MNLLVDILSENRKFKCSPYTQSSGFTILMHIVMHTRQHPELLDLIPKYIDKINEKNTNGWSELMLASLNSRTDSTEDTVKMLLDHGADMDLQENDGWAALMLASRYSRTDSTEDTVKMLLDHGADVNLQEKSGWTALMVASRNSRTESTEETVKMLLDHGADMNLQQNDGWTALMFASRNSRTDSTEETVKMLLDKLIHQNMNILIWINRDNLINRNIIGIISQRLVQ